jgi:hypothetical protein
MHRENANALPFEEPLDEDLAALVDDDPAPATPGDLDPPPHPATRTPAAISATAAASAHPGRGVTRRSSCLIRNGRSRMVVSFTTR